MAKDNHWFKHEYDADEGRKLVMLRRKGSYEAVGLYWTIYPKIHKASNRYPFATDDAREVLADSLRIDKSVLDKFINLAIECELFQINGDFLTSQKVAEQLEEQQTKSKSAAESGRLGGLAKASKTLANGKRIVASRVDIDKSRDRVDKNKKSTLSSADFIFPEKLNNQNCKTLLDEFIKHRSEKKAPVTKTQIEKVLKKYSEKPIDFITNLENSITNGYQGIFAPNQNGKAQTGKSVDPRINTILNSLGATND